MINMIHVSLRENNLEAFKIMAIVNFITLLYFL